jgi:hypothetical protein
METAEFIGAGPHEIRDTTNGAALAAFLAAGIGAFATGILVLVHEAGLFSAPALYGPSGGVSGRTTFAVGVWLVAWAVLHARWKGRQLAPRRVGAIALALTALGILGTFPPLWSLLP